MENRVPGVMQLVDGMKMIWDIGAGNREGVSGVDTAWLRMDRRTNLMMIVGVLMFEERMDYERLRAVLEERFLHYERFRQRVVKIGASHYWENDPLFSLQNHLQVLDLPDAQARERYGANLALLRPDQVVGWRGADDRQAHAVFARLLCQAA